MKKLAIFIYGVLSYLMFLGVFVYAVGFIGNIKISNSIDSIPGVPFTQALMINLGILSLFALQHSGMARKGFKNWITKYIPQSAERATYVLLSNVVMIVMFYFWEPMGGTIWSVESDLAKTSLMTLFMFGWALVLISTFLINHFHLFGLQQVWAELRGKTIPSAKFTTPSLYKTVRHPLYVGWIVVVWATPTMTAAHLVFAMMCTAYILIAIQFEEKDLINEFGDEYRQYKQDVPMIIPSVVRVKPSKKSFPEIV
jgi:protein-S-isoprenylcysteine O-methyltransferase Ste14